LAEEPNLTEAILKVEDAHTFIGHHHILQGLSFEAGADAVTVLIGRNGAGKSTTLRTVMGLLPANQGKIIFNGKEIQKKKPYEIARMGLGFVPEDMGIFANLTVEENMRVAMLVEDEATGERLERTLEMFKDLKNFWRAQAGILSGGQKQMLAIARAIVGHPSVIMADEPTGNLDQETGGEILELFDELRAGGQTMIIVTHDPTIAARARETIRIVDGLILPNGQQAAA